VVSRAGRAGARKSQPAQRSEQERLPVVAVPCGVGLKGAVVEAGAGVHESFALVSQSERFAF